MDLKTYFLSLTPEQREAFATRCDTTVGYLNLVINKHRKASSTLARRLSDASENQVGLSDIRPDIWPVASAA